MQAAIRSATGFFLLLGLCAGLAESAPDQSIETPAQIVHNHIYFSVRAGGRTYTAVYDTGAEVSLMSKAAAQELGVDVEAGEAGHGFGGDIESGSASNVALEFGSGAYTFDRIAVIDFSPMIGGGTRFDFILGPTLLPDSVATIDPAGRRLLWTPRGAFRAPASATELPLGLQNGAYTTPMQINNSTGTASVDIGSGTAVDLSAPFARRLGLNPSDGATWQSGGVGGRFVSHTTSLPQVIFAAVTMHDVPARISSAELPNGTDINLGTPILLRFQLAFDYAGRRLWLTPLPDAATAVFQRDLTGLILERGPNRELVITFVSDRGPAHDAGLLEGDTIIAIDGTAVSNWPIERPLLAETEGATNTLQLADGRTVILKLARYY